MCSAGCPLHLLLLDHALADHLVDRGFNEGRANHLVVPVAFAKVRDELLIVADVDLEFADSLGDLLRQWRGNLGKRQIDKDNCSRKKAGRYCSPAIAAGCSTNKCVQQLAVFAT